MYQSADQYYIERPRILAGPHPILDFARIDMIKEFAEKGVRITENEAIVAERDLNAAAKAKLPVSEENAMTLLPRYFPGGIRSPHVHYNGDIYLLNKENWNAFSSKIIEGFRTKLANAKGINYDQLMKLGDAMQEII